MRDLPVLGAVSAGGVIGACARYGIGVWWPLSSGGFPWATFAINVSGCLLIGMLMVAITDLLPARRLVRPFLGTGVLGGYTTFSTYIVDTQRLIQQGSPGVAFAYLAATLIAALLAVYTGSVLARAAVYRIRKGQSR